MNKYKSKNIKITFLYEGPHPVHAAWAKSLNAEFIANFGAGYKKGLKIISRGIRLLLSPIKLLQIPRDTDVLLCEGGLGFMVGFLFKKIRKRKVIIIASDPLFYKIQYLPYFFRRIFYDMVKNFDGFIATSKMMYNLIPFKKKEIVYPFADLKRFIKIKPEYKENIIFVGALNKLKGVDKLVDIFLKIQKKVPKARLYLIGKGNLEEKIKSIKNKNIILLGYRKKPEKYMKKMLIYVNLSRFDSFSVGTIEAMAAGLVPVISKNVGAKEVVEKIDKNLIVDNEEEAVSKISYLFQNTNELKTLSKKCKKEAVNFSKKESVKKFKKAFIKLIDTSFNYL